MEGGVFLKGGVRVIHMEFAGGKGPPYPGAIRVGYYSK